MRIAELTQILSHIREEHGNIEVLVHSCLSGDHEAIAQINVVGEKQVWLDA